LGKSIFFEEKADFVSRGEKVVVANMAYGRSRVFGGKFRKGVGRKRDLGKEIVGLVEERGDL